LRAGAVPGGFDSLQQSPEAKKLELLRAQVAELEAKLSSPVSRAKLSSPVSRACTPPPRPQTPPKMPQTPETPQTHAARTNNTPLPDLNTASAAAIMAAMQAAQVKGVGDTKARRLVAARDAGGPFLSWEDVKMRVDYGLGGECLDRLQEAFTLAVNFNDADEDSLENVLREALQKVKKENKKEKKKEEEEEKKKENEEEKEKESRWRFSSCNDSSCPHFISALPNCTHMLFP